MKEIKKLLAVVIVSCALTVGAVGAVNVAHVINELDAVKATDVSEEIADILYEGSKESLYGASYRSIVSKNTIHNGTYANDRFYYNHEGIAKDLLKLDGDMFDYSFCAVCTDMGKNINNLVGVGGRSNIDSVIFYLSLYSSMEGKTVNEYVKNAFDGVESLDDYLIKNGYVDKDGEPSFESFRKACDERAEEVLETITSKNDSKGASMA